MKSKIKIERSSDMCFISDEIFGDNSKHYLDMEFQDGYAIGFATDGKTPEYIATYPKTDELTEGQKNQIIRFDGVPEPRHFTPRDICLKFGKLRRIGSEMHDCKVSDRFEGTRPNSDGCNIDGDTLKSIFMFVAGAIMDDDQFDCNGFSLTDKYENAEYLFQGFYDLWGDTDFEKCNNPVEDIIINHIRLAMQEFDPNSEFFIENNQ